MLSFPGCRAETRRPDASSFDAEGWREDAGGAGEVEPQPARRDEADSRVTDRWNSHNTEDLSPSKSPPHIEVTTQ